MLESSESECSENEKENHTERAVLKIRRIRKNPGTMGRPRLDKKYPITKFVSEYILDKNPTAAHRSRASYACYTSRTAKSITKYVRQRIIAYCKDMGLPQPAEKDFPSVSTVRRQGVAPNPRFRAAKYYKGKIKFRSAPRKNDLTRFHPDFHISAAAVKIFLELSAVFKDDVLFLSCDNKNKLVLGAPANSNPAKPCGMYMTDSQPSLPDHNFPAPGAKITPMGYMEVNSVTRVRHSSLDEVKEFHRSGVVRRSRSLSPPPVERGETYVDAEDRQLHPITQRVGEFSTCFLFQSRSLRQCEVKHSATV